MVYKPELGLIGNLKRAFGFIVDTNSKVFNETNDRQSADTENREAVEQSLTDLYLDGIQAQQDITDIQLQLLGG